MKRLLIVPNAKKWPLQFPDVEVVSARKYITESVFSEMTGVRVFNLMHQHRYQGLGYYVSLLAEARGHRPVPNITTLRDLQTPAMVRMTNGNLQELIQTNLAPIKSERFELSIYFGNNMAKRYERLCRELFNRFHAHFLRAYFTRANDLWSLSNIETIGLSDIPDAHHDFIMTSAQEYFGKGGYRTRKETSYRYSLAILHRPEAEDTPSNPEALKGFVKAGRKLGLDVELITKDDFSRLSEFDALFIRETTSVNNHTFRFARYAEADGQVVIDDSQSIIRCANKVYLAEMLARQRVAAPTTMIVHKDNLDLVTHTLGLPCVLKLPDSSFSVGVKRVTTNEELETCAQAMLDKSELIVAQAFVPTEFDWRVGILDNEPLFVCRYYMAPKHWQILRRDEQGVKHEGRADTLALDQTPPEVVQAALRATRGIGRGFYGVDLKQIGTKVLVMEVNDNPNVDHGVEDDVLHEELYQRIMAVFLKRIEARKAVV